MGWNGGHRRHRDPIAEKDVGALTRAEALADSRAFADAIGRANRAYHARECPPRYPLGCRIVPNALKRRNAAIEERFPDLNRAPTAPRNRWGCGALETFSKVRHERPMLSLGNLRSRGGRRRRGRFRPGGAQLSLGLSDTAPLAFTVEPKIDGLSLSLLYEAVGPD